MQSPISLPETPGWVAESRTFITRGNVVDLAVGIGVGAAFTAIVNSLAKDLITPALGLIVGDVDFRSTFIALEGPGEAAQAAGAVTLNVGLFLNAVISFLIVSFAIFWMVKVLNRFVATKKAEEAEPGMTTSEKMLTEIRDLLARGARG